MLTIPQMKMNRPARFLVWGAIFLLALAVGLAIKVKMEKSRLGNLEEKPFQAGKSVKEKQREMLEELKKANASVPVLSEEEKIRKQREMEEEIEKANKKSQPISKEEQEKKQQDMLQSINEANK